jgi:hypothetical protein
VGSLEIPGLYTCDDLAVNGDRAYLSHEDGVIAVDIATPSTPAILGSWSENIMHSYLEVAGDNVYVSAYGWLLILDASEPTSITKVAEVALGGGPSGIAYEATPGGEYVYIGSHQGVPGNGVLHVFDVSNPAQPHEVGFYDLGDAEPRGLDVEGSVAFLSTGDQLWVIDLSIPALPQLMGQWDFGGGADTWRVQLNRGLAYVSGSAGMELLDACAIRLFADGFEIESTVFWD